VSDPTSLLTLQQSITHSCIHAVKRARPARSHKKRHQENDTHQTSYMWGPENISGSNHSRRTVREAMREPPRCFSEFLLTSATSGEFRAWKSDKTRGSNRQKEEVLIERTKKRTETAQNGPSSCVQTLAGGGALPQGFRWRIIFSFIFLTCSSVWRQQCPTPTPNRINHRCMRRNKYKDGEMPAIFIDPFALDLFG
jgi:hypothetical protein